MSVVSDGRAASALSDATTDSSRVPTPPPAPRKRVEGESEDFAANIKAFQSLCPTRTPVLEPQPLRCGGELEQKVATVGNESLWDPVAKDWVSGVQKQSLHRMTQSALQGGVGELHSALVPGEQPFGGFSPPVSPAKPPALQVALARNYPVSRLNPLPTVQQLMHRHKQGLLTQAQLWIEIERLRKHWAGERERAEQRVHAQRAYRDMLFGSMTGSGAATARATASAPMRLQPVEIDAAASTTKVALPGGRPTDQQGGVEFLSDGRHVSGVQSSDEKADAILARLNALAKPDSLLSASEMRRGSSASMPDSGSYRPTPPGSRASFNGNGAGSRAGSRTSSRMSTQSA